MMSALVNYDYIAAELGIGVETVRRYAWGARKKNRFPLFPKPVDPSARSPLFRKDDADRFIEDHRSSLVGLKPRGRERTRDLPEPEPFMVDGTDLVGREYFAERLGVTLDTVNLYAADDSSQGLSYFPRAITPRSHRTPLYRRDAADAFIARRLKESEGLRGRLRASAVTKEAKAVVAAASKRIGRPVDFESRVQLQTLLFTDLGLPETPMTARGPSVSTRALRELYKEHPNPILALVIQYRDLTVISA